MQEGTFGRVFVAIGLFLLVQGALALLDPPFLITTPGAALSTGLLMMLVGLIAHWVQEWRDERRALRSAARTREQQLEYY
jgi:membrane protease YdiL (CAAX protease family)